MMDVGPTVPIAMEVPLEILVDKTPFVVCLESADADPDALEDSMGGAMGLGFDPLQLVGEWFGG